MNSWLPLLACLVGGMILKWILDLFFLRAHLARLEKQANTREAEYIALKHDHSRALTELRNKLTELDATTKAKTLAEGMLAKRDSDLTALRTHLTGTESALADLRNRNGTLTERLHACALELGAATTSLAGCLTELEEQRSLNLELQLQLRQSEAAAQTQADTEASLRQAVQTLDTASHAAAESVARHEREIASQQSVVGTLTGAVRSRDARIADVETQLDTLEKERQSTSESLTAADRELSIRSAELTAARQELSTLQLRDGTQAQVLAQVQQELEAALGLRTVIEARLQQRELAAADWERKAAEFQRQMADQTAEHRQAAGEVARLKQSEVAAEKLRAELSSRLELAEANAATLRRRAEHADALELERATLARELQLARAAAVSLTAVPAPTPTPALADTHSLQRIADLEAEIEAVSLSHARLESDLASERKRIERLETELAARPVNEVPIPTAPELASPPPSAVTPVDIHAAEAKWLAELDELNRERNALAAELAALKAAQPPAPVSPPARRKNKPAASKAAATAAAIELFATLTPEAPAATPPDGPDPTEAVTEFSTRCPQHLSDVKGIGSVFEQRLYGAGVGSFWELSQLPDRRLEEILELDEPQRDQFDFAATRADAARLAQETQSIGRKWSGEIPDDLEPLAGIGPVYEQKLYHAGICTFAALAAATPELLAEICPGSPSRKPDYADWIAQARQLISSEEN